MNDCSDLDLLAGDLGQSSCLVYLWADNITTFNSKFALYVLMISSRNFPV